MVNKEKQIKVLLEGNAYAFACNTLGDENMMKRHYAEFFTVSTEEVYEYTQIHGIPYRAPTGKNAPNEGFHFYKEAGKWHTFLGREA